MKKILIIFIISVVIGSLFGIYIYKEYKVTKTDYQSYNETFKVYLLQIGAYEKEENVTRVTKSLPNYYVEKDNELYHIYVSIFKNKENADKIKEFYKVFGNNIYVKEKTINNKELFNMIGEYENILINTTKKDVVYTINKELLSKYKEVINA